MKNLYLFLFISVFALNGNTQITDTIQVSIDLNAYLIFGSDNIKFNYGSPKIKIDLADNKLTIQGLEEDFETTNLLVECDNKFYVYIIEYNERPSKYLHDYTNQEKPKKTNGNFPINESSVKQEILIDSTKIKQRIEIEKEQQIIKSKYDSYIEAINYYPQEIKTIGTINYGIKAVVTNINVVDDKLLIKVSYKNESDINYDIDYFEIVVTEKQKYIKKNTTQEIPCEILHSNFNLKTIKANDQLEVVYVLNKVTISRKKEMVIRMIEKNKNRRGDRDISVKIPYQYVTKASAL